jgi:hypothetical protein
MDAEEQSNPGEASKDPKMGHWEMTTKVPKKRVQKLVPSTSEPWNQRTKKVPKTQMLEEERRKCI